MKKIVGVILATVAVGFVAFQNCQKAPHPDDISTAAVGVQGSSSKVDLQTQKISDTDFLFQENTKVVKNSVTYDVLVNKNLKVVLPSGQMFLTSDLTSTTEKFCLTETLRNELISILKSSQICKSQSANAGQLCTQALKLPYAIITTEKESFSLGSATDGCGSNSQDLCGEQAGILKGFIASVKTNYRSFVCQE